MWFRRTMPSVTNVKYCHFVLRSTCLSQSFSVPQDQMCISPVPPYLQNTMLPHNTLFNTDAIIQFHKITCHCLEIPLVPWSLSFNRYEGVSKSFRTESITKYTPITINTRWEATQRVMAAKLTRLTHKIAIQLHLVAESCTIYSSRSRRSVRKLLDTPSYLFNKHIRQVV
jgi:hypothetical protein